MKKSKYIKIEKPIEEKNIWESIKSLITTEEKGWEIIGDLSTGKIVVKNYNKVKFILHKRAGKWFCFINSENH